jgi:succinoglycan biosynthesis protein ExoA
MTAPLISICILAGHGSTTLADCLDSLRAQEDAPRFELIVGGRHGAAEVAVVEARFPAAEICDHDRGHPGSARNALIARARGELLLFLDDDVTVSAGLLRRLADLADEHPEASVFGGPNDTPPRSSRFQVVQGAVLGSVVGSGPVSRRYGARHPGMADERWFTLCNLAVRRGVMLPFMNDLVCAEENALLAQLRSAGRLMRYDPTLRVFHKRRATWRGFAAQMFKYGRGRGQLVVREPGTARVAYLLPSAVLIYLIVVLALAVTGSEPPATLLVPIAAYAALALAGASWIALTLRRVTAVPIALGLILTVHGCYGAGVLRGLVSPRRSAAARAAARAARLDGVAASEPRR